MGALLKIYTSIFVQFLSNFSCGKTVWMRLKASPALKGLILCLIFSILFQSWSRQTATTVFVYIGTWWFFYVALASCSCQPLSGLHPHNISSKFGSCEFHNFTNLPSTACTVCWYQPNSTNSHFSYLQISDIWFKLQHLSSKYRYAINYYRIP